MSSKYKIRDQEKPYFVSFATVNWIDVFIRNEYRQVVTESIRYCQKEKGLELYAWCIMSSHVHMIIGTIKEPMEGILRDMKSFTSRKMKEEIANHPGESRKEWLLWFFERAGKNNSNNNSWQFWQQDNQPKEIRGDVMAKQKLDYIHNNPVEAGYVAEPGHWLYSSALDYSGGKGLLEIKHLFG